MSTRLVLKPYSHTRRYPFYPLPHKPQGLSYRPSLTIIPDNFHVPELWVGYLINRERVRINMTQLKLAGELDFGMSCISTIEAGHAYANIGRTLLLLRRLHLEAGICLSAITAQANIHFHLVVDFQTVGRAIATLDPSWNQSTIPYLS